MGLDERIVANRTFGRVDEYDGEYVETEFTCLGGVGIPLVPGRSFWITHDRRGQRIGFPIQLHLRSVAAAYLRVWAPGIAIVVLALSSSSLATGGAAVLFGLCAWSWTWWPRDAAVRRGSDFDLAAFGSRCDPARMTDAMHEFLSHQLQLRASAGADPRPPDDVVRFGARTVDEALLAYGLLRLAAARMPRPRRSPYHLDGADQMISSAFRRLRSRGGPYRDRPTANALELWPAISAAARDRASDRRAVIPSLNNAVPDSAVFVPPSFRNPWIWLAVLAVSTIFAGVALRITVAPQRPAQPARAKPAAPRRAPAAPMVPPSAPPREAPRRIAADELARRPLGEYVTVQCDYVQNSDRGSLRRVTLCGVGPRILAVAGGNRRHDDGRMLQGHIEMIPDGHRPSWASALRNQLRADSRYYDFYLERDSHGDDTPDDPDGLDDEGDRRDAYWGAVDRHDHRGNKHPHDDTSKAFLRAVAVASSLATLAGWFVWIRLWQLRRRAATWIVTG